MAPSATDGPVPMDVDEKTYPPAKIFPVKEPKFEKIITPQFDGREKALAQPSGGAVIVIDNGKPSRASPPRVSSRSLLLAPSLSVNLTVSAGSSAIRVGWSFENRPRFIIPPIAAKYRDRKLSKTFSFAGSDCYAEPGARSHIRNAFEAGTGIVSNWDTMEHLLDYIFIKLGMNGDDGAGAIDMPIVMTEAVANLPYSRKSAPSCLTLFYMDSALTPWQP